MTTNINISDLPTETSPDGTDYLVGNFGTPPITKKILISSLPVVTTDSSLSALTVVVANHTNNLSAISASVVALNTSFNTLSTSVGSSLIGFLQVGTGAVLKTAQSKMRETVSVLDFGADPTGVTDSTAAFQKAVDYFQTVFGGYTAPLCTVKIPTGTYKISATTGVVINYSTDVMQLSFEADSGAVINGTGTNKCFSFTNGGYRNVFSKLNLLNFGTAIYWTTNNRVECQLVIDNCGSGNNDIFLDTNSYAVSRSSMVRIKDCLCTSTRVFIKHYTDQMTVENTWVYAKEASLDALFYLSGEGNVHIKDSFLIPHGTQVSPIASSRWIDFVSNPAECTEGDRALKILKLSNVRQSLESGRPLIWTFDTCSSNPSGSNQASSITIEDSACIGTGGYPLVWYRQGWPGNVNFRNAKVLASEQICAIYTGNTNPPVRSTPGAITSHVIMIDEATRLSQSNSNNVTTLVDPNLEVFCYDTTTQTSKFKTSIPKNIDYRLRAVTAPGAGANKVKTTIPVFFDSVSSVENRDILTFILVTISDAGSTAFSVPKYRSTAVTMISVVGGEDGGVKKRITATVLQDAKGGISNFTDSTAVPTVFWGTGDTGTADILANSTAGTEDNITFVWSSSNADTSWAYLLPLAGIRANQQDKMQNNVW